MLLCNVSSGSKLHQLIAMAAQNGQFRPAVQHTDIPPLQSTFPTQTTPCKLPLTSFPLMVEDEQGASLQLAQDLK